MSVACWELSVFQSWPEWRCCSGLIYLGRGEIEYLGFGWSAINHRRSGELLADWRQGKAGCCRVPVRLFVLFTYGVIDGPGGAEAVDRAGCGEREQRYRLRDRHADRAAGVCSGQPVLYRDNFGGEILADALDGGQAFLFDEGVEVLG